MKVLTPEQQKLVAENHNLIYSFMNKNKLSFNDVEDWYGACAVGLCKAGMNYVEDKNVSFSTFAYVCMSNEMKQILRKNKIQCISLETTVSECENITLNEIVRDRRNMYDEVDLLQIVRDEYLKLKPRDRLIVSDCIYTDMNHTDIGKIYGVSQPTVCRVFNGFLNRVYEKGDMSICQNN